MASKNSTADLLKPYRVSDDQKAEHDTRDWQIGKSVLESNSYVLEKQLNCDVFFEVMDNQTPKKIGAHSFYLISRSPVFGTMFSERWSVDNKGVQIVDVSYGTFWEFLRFLYTEKCDINAGNALPLVYLGEKYMHTQIVEKCTSFIEKTISPSNVCTLYRDSVTFHVDNLEQMCKSYIVQNAGPVLSYDDFLHLDYQLMLNVVSSDVLLGSDERQIYQSCLKWAIHQCKLTNKSPTVENIRTVLGAVLFQIRLPTMSAQDLADTIGQAGVVTSAERGDIYTYILTRKQEPHMIYSLKPRSYFSKAQGAYSGGLKFDPPKYGYPQNYYQ